MIELRLLMIEEGKPNLEFVITLTKEDMQLARMVPGDLGPFKSPEIHALNNRRGQAALVKRAASMLGTQAADFRDDRDGWNGARRQALIEESYRRS